MPTTFLRTNAPFLTAAGLIAGVVLLATGLWPLRVIGVACLAVALLVPFLRLGSKPKPVAGKEPAAESRTRPLKMDPTESPSRGVQSFGSQPVKTSYGTVAPGWGTRHAQQATGGHGKADTPSPGMAKPANRPQQPGAPERVTKHNPHAPEHR